jgi:hypothetical protein
MKIPESQQMRGIAAAATVVVLALCSWFSVLDSTADQQVDAGLKRALVSFAAARALNAVISVAQGTEVAVEPGGVGVVFTPGEALDPINDLVEQFSNLMLLASVSFGVQKVLLSVGIYWVVALLLSATALLWVLLRLRPQAAPAWLSRLLVILLMVRFAVPLSVIGTDWLFRQFMAQDYQASQQVIDTASGRLDRLNSDSGAISSQNMLDTIRNWWAKNADLKAQFDRLRQAAEQSVEHVIRLMVIFLLQTLVFPLLLLWLLYGMVRRLFDWPDRHVSEN